MIYVALSLIFALCMICIRMDGNIRELRWHVSELNRLYDDASRRLGNQSYRIENMERIRAYDAETCRWN